MKKKKRNTGRQIETDRLTDRWTRRKIERQAETERNAGSQVDRGRMEHIQMSMETHCVHSTEDLADRF